MVICYSNITGGTASQCLALNQLQNVADMARMERGVETISEFFGLELTRANWPPSERRADVIHSHNVLTFVADLQGFVAGIAAMLQPGGVWVNESHTFSTCWITSNSIRSITNICAIFHWRR